MSRRLFIPILVLCFSLSGCKLLKDLVPNLVEGVEEEIGVPVDSLGYHYGQSTAEGAIKGLNTDSSKMHREEVIGALLQQLRDSVQLILQDSKDSILSPENKEYLVQLVDTLAQTTQTKLRNILDDPVGVKFEEIAGTIEKLLKDIFEPLNSGSLSDNLQAMTDSIVRAAVAGAMDEFDANYQDKIGKNISNSLAEVDSLTQNTFITFQATSDKTAQNIKQIAWVLGGIALVLIIVAGIFYVRGRKHKETLKVLTRNINDIPNQEAYDQLVRSIQQETTSKGLENNLVNVLKEQNLYQQPEWSNKNQRLAELYRRTLQESGADEPVANVLKRLKNNAAGTDLSDQFDGLKLPEEE